MHKLGVTKLVLILHVMIWKIISHICFRGGFLSLSLLGNGYLMGSVCVNICMRFEFFFIGV